MTQTGNEKELVLGNKQLISLFFVVVALCGVFFAMGYMIGRNSTKGSLVTTSETVSPPNTAQRQQPEPPRETDAGSTEAAAPGTYTAPPPPVATKPAQDAPATETSAASAPAAYTPEPAADRRDSSRDTAR